MAIALKIKGGNALKGEVTPIANKNSVVAALPAAILSNKVITYKNIPNSTDVIKILKLLTLLGAKIDDKDFNNLKIDCKNLNSYKVDKNLGEEIRASIMFAGPLLARFGIAEIPLPGGCSLGERSIHAHINVFKSIGIKIEYFDGYIRFTAPSKIEKSYNLWPTEASVTATENLLMYAAGINATTEITDAACEPHVSDLAKLLSKMGAKITGISSNKLNIIGTKTFKKATFTPGPDFVDIAGFIVAASITKGKIKIKNGNIPEISKGLISHFKQFNISIVEKGDDLIVDGSNKLIIDVKNSGFPLAGPELPKLCPRPWPGFPADVIPVMVTLASKTQGRLLINNWMYETGLNFINELNKMGADIYMSDPNKVIVSGPVKFKGGDITSPGVIQACKAMFLASLCDPVETVLYGSEILKRRYPNIVEVYKSLGADIEELKD